MGICLGYGLVSAVGLAGWYLCRRRGKKGLLIGYLPVMGIVALLCLAVAALEGGGEGGKEAIGTLPRQESGDQQVELFMDANGLAEKGDYTVLVQEQKLTEAQKQKLLEAAAEELEKRLLEDQEKDQVVSKNLSVPSALQAGRVLVSLTFWPGDLIDIEGVIHWEYFDESDPLVQVSALLECQETEMIHEFYLQLERPSMSESGEFYAKLDEKLKEQNEKTDTKELILPTEVSGVSVMWYMPKEQLHWKVLLLGIIGILAHYVAGRAKKEQIHKAWQEGLRMDYPDIVSRLSLLVGAGMTVSGAIGKLASEYQKGYAAGRQRKRPGYEELQKTWNEIQDGTGERKAYENLGVRCDQPQYRKLSSLLIQNIQKGAKGIQQLLDAEVTEVYLQQRADVRQRGEEAAARLLLPMGIMLVLVFAILIIPAMFSLQLS